MNKNLRIMFLRDSSNRPVGCVAIQLDRSHRRLSYQLSVLNPVDRFNRAIARQVALGRLVEVPISIRLPANAVNMHEISAVVMHDIVKSKAPSRAIKAAKAWLAPMNAANARVPGEELLTQSAPDLVTVARIASNQMVEGLGKVRLVSKKPVAR